MNAIFPMNKPFKHKFGGEWTRQKLAILEGYLNAYCSIFNNNQAARYFDTWYVDAFAGTGYVAQKKESNNSESASILGDLGEPDSEEFLKGSARIALDISPGFRNHLFIDKSAVHCAELESLKTEYPSSRVNVVNGEANEEIEKWVNTRDWGRTRAVVFLDPYGMQVSWKTVELLAGTHGVDLWLLLPIGVALNRLLPRKGQPVAGHADRIDDFLGSQEWREEFYQKHTQNTLFGDEEVYSRTVDIDALGEFVIRRLKGVFHAVHSKPKALNSSRGNPLYLFCFAAGNERGAQPAMRIASHLLKDGVLN